jgi:HlyD family secretion protein
VELDTNYKESKSFLKKIKLKPVLFIVISVILAAAIIMTLVLRNNSNKSQTTVQRTTKVAKGNLNVTVTGSGSIESSNESDITSSVQGKITKIYFKEGDSVKAGDLLFELDDSDAKLNVEKIKNNIAQTQLSANSNTKNVNSLDIRAPFSGQVTNLASLKVGDEVMKGATVLTITDLSQLKLDVTFSGSIINQLKVGKNVIVNIQDLMNSVTGVISYISSAPSSTGSGGNVYDVEVTLKNPGSLKAGMNASVEVETSAGSETSINSSKLEYLNTQVIKSVAGGTVTSVKVKENQSVPAGQSLIRLNNDDLEVSTQTNDLKLQDLNNQLATAEKQLKEYKIYSPIDGIIVSLNELNIGNSVKPADILTTITDPGHMEFKVSIDELDIAKIKLEQKVNVTIDALPETTNKPLSGQVTKIAIEGTSSNGVTTYPVTVQVNETENLKVGMNANAEIIISEKTDTLIVPLEAVQKLRNRSFVMVKGNGTNQGSANSPNSGGSSMQGGQGTRSNNASGNNGGYGNGATSGNRGNRTGKFPGGSGTANSAFANYYKNVVMRPVEVGINNDEYIEIISGLKEGEEIILPMLTTGTTQSTQQGGLGIPGMGGGGFGGGFGGGQRQNAGSGGNGSQNRNNSGNNNRNN